MLIKHYNLKNYVYNFKKQKSVSSAVGVASSVVGVLVWLA